MKNLKDQFSGNSKCSDGVSKEPQLAEVMQLIEDTEIDPHFYIKFDEVSTNCADAYDRDSFLSYYKMDNFEALTIKFKPELWSSKSHCYHKLIDYMKSKKDFLYYFIFETGENNNLHVHGIFGFPNEKARKNFQVWVNKYLGKIHKSPKDDNTNLNGWYDYIHKKIQKPEDLVYMFGE